MAGFRGIIVSIITVMLCIFFIFGFIGNYLSVTNPESPILEDKYELNSSKVRVEERLDSISGAIGGLSEDLSSATVDPVGYLFLISKAMFTIPQEVFKLMIDAVVLLPTMVFGNLGGTGWGDLLIFGMSMMGVVLIITIILLTIKIIRTGESER